MPENKTDNYDHITPEQLQVVAKITRRMTNYGDQENILEMILDELIQLIRAEVGAFVTYNPNQETFEPKTIKSAADWDVSKIEFSQSTFRQVLERREAVLSFDTRTDENYAHRQSVIINQIHAILAFPLIIQNEVFGILYFDSRKNRQSFNESARQFLSFFATIASLTLEHILNKKHLENENVVLKNRLEQDSKIPTMIGESEVMKNLFRMIRKVAKSDASVIITGENGTGKDLVARALHDFSDRRDKPYLAQYIGNFPATILESELFGYKRGAFTGAITDKIGLFEAVNEGTLFLDEIGDLPPELQAKLLRVLQNQEIKRLGENIVRSINVRVLAATNKDLTKMVKEGTFREDLFYRLNVVKIEVPPLRDRKTDIPLLADYFLKKENPESSFIMDRGTLVKLNEYDWPGNVRQLENVIKRASIFANDGMINADDILFDDTKSRVPPTFTTGTLEELKNHIIAERIKQMDGNKTQAAKSLDISLRSLQAKAKELGL